MAQSRLQIAINSALAGIYAVYALIVIARAGYETGQVLAGRISIAGAFARLDVSGGLLFLGDAALFMALQERPKTQAAAGSTSPRFSRWRIIHDTTTAPTILPRMNSIQFGRFSMSPGAEVPAIT